MVERYAFTAQELEGIDVPNYSGNFKDWISWTAISCRSLIWRIDVGSLIESPFQKVVVADYNVLEDREPKALAIDIVATCDEGLWCLPCKHVYEKVVDEHRRRARARSVDISLRHASTSF
jgi:hypothetical protein